MPFERSGGWPRMEGYLETQEHPIVHLVVHCYIAVCPTFFANQIKISASDDVPDIYQVPR